MNSGFMHLLKELRNLFHSHQFNTFEPLLPYFLLGN
jgi:hypothetical protein